MTVFSCSSYYEPQQILPLDDRGLCASPQGCRITTLVCAEIGGYNSIEPLLVGARLGLPVIDADGMGRAFPEIQMYLPLIYGCRPWPSCVADNKGDVVSCSHVTDAKSLEGFFRIECIRMGCVQYLLACLLVCMFACLHVCLFACLLVCMFVRLHVCLFTCFFVCMFVCLLVCMFVRLHVCMFACLHVCLFACLFVCLLVGWLVWGCLPLVSSGQDECWDSAWDLDLPGRSEVLRPPLHEPGLAAGQGH